MANIRTGYVHLINSITDTITLSQGEIDTVKDGVGFHLEKSLQKILDKHDRRPGVFKANSTLKPLFEQYATNKITLDYLSSEILQTIAEAKFKEGIQEKTMLFILEGEDSIYVIDAKRDRTAFQLTKEQTEDGTRNVIEETPFPLPTMKITNLSFFEVNLKDLSVNVLEKMTSTPDGDFYLLADVVLKVDTKPSLNEYLKRARKIFYNLVLKSAHATLEDFEKKADIELVNEFEQNLYNQVWATKEINFKDAAKVFKDGVMRNKFISKLEEHQMKITIKALSDKDIDTKTASYKPKRVYLENGVQVLIPDDVEELDIKIKEIDGELKEIGGRKLLT